jgi:two-component system CheB/CheR fusion protein
MSESPEYAKAADTSKQSGCISGGGSVVGIGASAGGLEALKAFAAAVPSTSPHAYVVIQHLSPDYKSMMAELLGRSTELAVTEAAEGMELSPGTIHLIPPGKNMELVDGHLRLTDKPTGSVLNLPIDIFFRSLARELGEHAIGVILTGTGSDGSRGVRAINEAGGIVFVQDPSQAAFDGMPLSAIETGLADFVRSVEDIPAEIQMMLDQGRRRPDQPEAEDEVLLSQVTAHLRESVGVDFSHYKRPTLYRRIARRVNIRKCDSLASYIDVLRSERSECEALTRECLIGITKFFRDGSVWDSLADGPLPELIDEAVIQRRPLRIWSVGCSTGEEAYTVAMVAEEQIARTKQRCELQIFATDLSPDHLSIAAAGVYSESMVADIWAERLGKYFTRRGEVFQVTPTLRSRIIFSPHNIVEDPPFKNIDLVICRNLLIYLQPGAQHRAISALHYALRPDGVLMLGSSESVGNHRVSLTELDPKANLFRNSVPSQSFRIDNLRTPVPIAAVTPPSRRSTIESKAAESLGNILSEELGLAVVFVDHDFEIVYASGDMKRVANLPPSGFSSNLLKLLNSNLAATVSTAVRQSRLNGTKVGFNGVRIDPVDSAEDDGGTDRRINLLAQPVQLPGLESRDGHAVIFFPAKSELSTPLENQATLPETNLDGDEALRVVAVEQELQVTRDSLYAAIEQLESTNEELQASNEELMAANEEMQSTNEELQSMNEELHTVNAEHQQKILDLGELNAEIDSLMESTDIGTIFLDRRMRIRKFTPAVRTEFNLRSIDVGRPLSDLTSVFGAGDSERLLDEAQQVLQQAEARDVELTNIVQRGAGPRSALAKLVPFYDRDGVVDGVVMSFVDVTELNEARDRLIHRNALFEQVLLGARAGYWEHQLSSEYFALSRSAKQLLGYAEHEIGDTLDELKTLLYPADSDLFEQALRDAAAPEETADGDSEVEVRFRHRNGSVIWMLCRGRRLADSDPEGPVRTIGSMVDITGLKQTLSDLQRSNDELHQFAYLTSHDLQEPLRTVSNFVDLLERRHGELLDDDGRQFLSIVAQATVRMRDLIRGILDYSRIGHHGTRTVVDTDEVLQAAITDLGSAFTDVGATIDAKPLPKVVGYEAELRTLFTNLLSNAVKFSRADSPLEITIRAELRTDSNEGWRFSVSDNGIGIAEQHQERIFEIFSRLHNRDDYPGAGIGLAHCRKIVELHGGRLTVESVPDVGSTFSFTLNLTNVATPQEGAETVEEPART